MLGDVSGSTTQRLISLAKYNPMTIVYFSTCLPYLVTSWLEAGLCTSLSEGERNILFHTGTKYIPQGFQLKPKEKEGGGERKKQLCKFLKS